MPRQLRIEYPGAIYHVMNRGNRSEDIFRDNADRRCFVDTLGEACEKTRWQVHAFCLMSNHVHLVVETPRANLVAGMRWLFSTYTARFNRRHQVFGHLFGGRYKSLIVDGSGHGYLKTVCDYVHLNPVRAGLLGPRQDLGRYAWSSYPQYVQPPSRRQPWLRVDRLLGENGIQRDDRQGRSDFQRQMDQRRNENDGDLKALRRGWCWGPPGFRRKLLALLPDEIGEQHPLAAAQEAEQDRADRLVRETLAEWRWQDGELAKRRKGDKMKVKLAAQLRKETTMGWRWIASRLHMGHWGSVANLVRSVAK